MQFTCCMASIAQIHWEKSLYLPAPVSTMAVDLLAIVAPTPAKQTSNSGWKSDGKMYA